MTNIPSLEFISDITQAQNAVVTFTTDHNFFLNEIVSFRVSKDYGMVEMNNLSSKIIDMDSTSITTEINSRNFTAFSVPVSLLSTTPPVCVPSTSGVDLTNFVPTMILDDAFDNRSS